MRSRARRACWCSARCLARRMSRCPSDTWGSCRPRRRAAARGVPVYGECGGLMYLARVLIDGEGRRHEMVGLLPAESTMAEARLSLGYREAESRGTPLLPAGARVRGHEFHWSTLT